MKGGKEDKILGPMLPRLHVNDTDKGGPRAPPRNKMALYEQLSVSSNRFTHPAASLVLSSSQGNANESGVFPSYHMATQFQSEKQYTQNPDLGAQLTQVEQRKKLENGVFAVPTFVHSVPNQEHCEYINQLRECIKTENMGMLVNSVNQETKSRRVESSEKLITHRINPFSTPSAAEKAEVLKKKTDNSGHLDTYNSVEYNPDSKRCNHPSVLDGKIVASERRSDSTSVMEIPLEDQNILHDISNNTEFQDWPYRSPQMRRLERVDSLSENSVVDSISRLDITPDNVVGIIGQKHFWKARREIANQQRIFAIQVFELHRLMKVQRLIAASPHILLDDSAFFSKPIKASPGKRKPPSNPLKESPHVPKSKDRHKTETAVKNATEKRASSASVHNGLQFPSFNPVGGDYNPGPWGFRPQALGNQWLIPMMSPSEGLVYKPYPGPGFMGPPYGGCGPPGSSPLMSNFPNPTPTPQFPSFPPASPHGYFPPYAIAVTNGPAFSGSPAQQVSDPTFPGKISARDMPSHQKRDGRNVLGNFNTPKDFEAQVSCGSNPVESNAGKNSVEERNVLPLFPTSPSTNGPKPGPQPTKPEGLTRAIKAVPHNARSASECAARIFESIQEGRKQNDLS